jgi:hypothetical protein
MDRCCYNCLHSSGNGVDDLDGEFQRIYPQKTIYLCKLNPPTVWKSNSDSHLVISVFPPICNREECCSKWTFYESK